MPAMLHPETPMQYKTIVLELLKDQYPALHEQLRTSRTLLEALNRYAITFKEIHSAWIDRLSQQRPGSGQIQIANMALELALDDLKVVLQAESPPDVATEPLSLDAAMAYLKRHTPPA